MKNIVLAFSAALALTACSTQSGTKQAQPVPVEKNQPSPQSDAARHTKMPVLVQADGTYSTVPIEKDTVVVKVLQTTVDSLGDFPTVKDGLNHNLKHMEEMADKACNTGKKPDFLLYHEFPLTGYSSGSRAEKLNFTVEVPGPETERLGKIAKACDTYIVFGTYATDADWPNHILSVNAVIGRDGALKKAFWKSRNIKRIYEDREIMTTTIEAVRDKYREKYGAEEEFPILQTEFGNIAVSTVQNDPFIFAAFAMRGAEIMIRTATLFNDFDVQATAAQNNFYSTMTNIAFDIPGYNAGESIIVGPNGHLLAKSESKTEDDIIEAEIPIKEFRKGRRIPNFAYEMTTPVMDQYVQEFPINHLDIASEDLPQTGAEMKELMEGVSRFSGNKTQDLSR
ncbi:nitrilase-related carbon-nitrogen hydrolase [Litorimonas haliclonae]|uniref:nitrilase-related carbon-nitrogen hydrolase n=1 Tax=Litorimonas haliclonae TaxID=2081977 RepID=UPI0039EFCB55